MLSRIIVLPIVCASLFAACSQTNSEHRPPLPRRLHEQQFKFEFRPATHQNFFVADIDDNGDDDLLADRPSGLQLYTFALNQFTPVGECTYGSSGYVYGIYDVDGDGALEFFHNPDPHNGRAFTCYDCFGPDAESAQLYRMLLPSFRSEYPNAYDTCQAFVMNCFDADGDGRAEVYAAFNSLKGKQSPRSLRVYDGPTGVPLWSYDMGPHMKSCALLSDQDHDPQIIVATFASDNGVSYGGLPDNESYVLSFNPAGGLLWKFKTTDKKGWCNIDVDDIDNDGDSEIIVTRWLGEEQSKAAQQGDIWSVAVIDPYRNGRTVRKKVLHTGTDLPELADLSGGAELEAVVIGQDKMLYILGHELELIAKCDDRTHALIHDIRDIDRDGSREILCSGDGLLMVRNNRGTLTAEMRFGRDIHQKCREARIAGINDRIYIVAADRGYLRYFLYERPTFIEAIGDYSQFILASPWGIVLLLAAGGGAGAVFCSLFSRLRRSSAQRTPGENAAAGAADDLLHAMTAFSHGGASTSVLDRLCLHLNNWERSVQRYGEVGKFTALARSYSESVVPDLNRITILARRAGVPEQVCFAIKPAAKKASVALSKLCAAPSSFETSQGPVREAALALDEISRAVTGIRTFLRSLFRAPVTATAMTVLCRLGDELERERIGTTVTAAGIRGDSAFVAVPVIEKVLTGLVQNAVRAVDGSEERVIGIAVGDEGGYITIDVSDTGCGIAQTDHERIFDRQYTTKEDGGFGLFYAREELAVFSGKMFVLSSAPGAGTTIRIVLKKSEEAMPSANEH